MPYEDFEYRYGDVDVRKPDFRGTGSRGLSAATIILIVLGVLGAGAVIVGFIVLVSVLSMAATNSGTRNPRASANFGDLTGGSSGPEPLQLQPGRADPAGAFDFDDDRLSPNEANALARFFDDLNASLPTQRASQLTSSFDGERLFLDLERLGGIKKMPMWERSNHIDSYRAMKFPDTWIKDWKRLEFKKACHLRGSRREAAVLVNLRMTQDNVVHRQLWWLRFDGQAWKWYDFEYLDSKLPASIDQLQISSCRVSAEWVREISKFDEILKNTNDVEKIETLCAELEVLEMPRTVRLILYLWQADARLRHWKLADAHGPLCEALAIAPDHPAALLLDMQLHRHEGDDKGALQSADRIVALFGGDAQLFNEIGQIQLRLNKTDAATAAFRKGLDDDPGSFPNLTGLARTFLHDPDARITPEQKRELSQRMAQATPKLEYPAYVLGAFTWDKKQADVLEAFLEGFRKAAPDSLDGDYYEVRLKILKDETEPACVALGKLLPRVREQAKSDEYLQGFLSGMIMAGKALEGYKAAPDSKQAFKMLADQLYDDEDRIGPGQSKLLNDLIALHSAKFPDDTWLPYFRGQVMLANEQVSEAETELKKGLAQPGIDGDERKTYASAFVWAAHRAGDGLAAYEHVEDKQTAFGILSWQYRNARDRASLGSLIESHRKTGDESLALWEAELKMMEGDYAAASRVLRTKKDRLLANPQNVWRFKDLLVRSLAHEKKKDEALRELQVLDKGYQDRLLEAVIYALAGDVDATQEALDRAVKSGSGAWSFHADPDLGPILRSVPFKKLCDKYPEAGPGN
jgi:predicted Zn-dependent protease